MDVVLYPDPRLRAKNAPVEVFDAELAATARAMFEAMYRTEGVGLAAPQVGINRRLLVYNPTGKAEEADLEIVLCNPKIAWKSRVIEPGREGCLSFPAIYGQIDRPIAVKIEAQGLDGAPVTLELEDWDARIFLHEFDHLDGVLFTDRMTPADKTRNAPALEELVDRYREKLASS
ncbi:MAG: peptide deformylase [Planctomycetota bacterium]|nr:peptide deformylase [Planctomycetota bacterium]